MRTLVSHCQDSGKLSGSTSVCPVPHTLSKHCSYTNKTWKFVLRLDCCVSTEYSKRALYSTGSSSPLLGIGPSNRKTEAFLFLCAAVVIYLPISSKLTVGHYIHSLSQIYTPDSAIYSRGCNCREYIAESGVYMPYMMPCSTLDPPTHHSIYCYTHTQIYIHCTDNHLWFHIFRTLQELILWGKWQQLLATVSQGQGDHIGTMVIRVNRIIFPLFTWKYVAT